MKRKTSGCYHGLTAASAAIADEVNALSHIFTKLDQLVIISQIKKVQAF